MLGSVLIAISSFGLGILLTLLLYAWPAINSLEGEIRSLKHDLEGEKGAKKQALKIIVALTNLPEVFSLNELKGVDDQAQKLITRLMPDQHIDLDRNETIRAIAEWHDT